jgi:xylulokinase
MDPLYLGIDLGTSASKAVLVGPDGRVVARSRAAHPDTRTGKAGRVDPGPWVRSLAEACAALGQGRARVTALSMAVHSPVALFLDSNGVPLAPGVGWEHPELARHCASAGVLRTPAEAGLVANPTLPATTMGLAWSVAAEEHSDLVDQCVTLGLVGTWLGQFLTGRAALDPTQASYVGLMASTDGSNRWIDDLADRYRIPRSLLPDVLPSLSVLGALTEDAGRVLGVPAGVPVAVGAGDTASAAYLLGIEEGGPPLYTVGTTHVITTCSRTPDPSPIALARSHVTPGRWLSHGATNGGDALALGARLLGHGDGGDAVRRMTTAAGHARVDDVENAPVFIPHVAAERGPLWLDQPRTALVDLLPTTSGESAAWGVTEGVAFASRLVLEMCTAGKLDATTPVLLTGNFSAADAFPQIVADVLGRPVDLVDESHLPAMGAAAMAAAATHGIALPGPPARRVLPRQDWVPTVARRWQLFARHWTTTVGRPFPVDVTGANAREVVAVDRLTGCPA